MNNNTVIVVGGTHHNTLSMLRSLGKKGIFPDLILCDNKRKSYVLKSRYVKRKYIAKDSADALRIMNTEYIEKGEIPILIICSDDVASLYSADIALYMDKQRQVELAKNVGLNIPESITYRIEREKNPVFDTYPCIVKPLASIHGGKRINICYNKDDLHRALSSYHENDTVQIQQYIHCDYEIVVDGASVNGDVIIPGYVRKYRDIMGGTSFSATYSIDKLPLGITTSIEKMVLNIGYEGLFGVELLFYNGTFYFVEINLRNDATTYSIVKAGANLPYIYILAKQGIDYSTEIDKKIATIKSMVELRDFSFVLKRKLSIMNWLQELKQSACLYFYDREDMKPFWNAITTTVMSHLRK